MDEVLVLLLLIAVGCALFALWSRVRYARLARQRAEAGATAETFQQAFKGQVASDLIQTAYRHFSALARPNFPVLPTDDLGHIYGLAGEDVPDELTLLAKRCGVRTPLPQELSHVQTVADAIELLQSLRSAPASPGMGKHARPDA